MKKPPIYVIPDDLAEAYRGAGHALAAVLDEQIMKFIYLSDVLPGFDPANLDAAVVDDRLAPIIRELQPFGQISFGMISGGEFTQL